MTTKCWGGSQSSGHKDARHIQGDSKFPVHGEYLLGYNAELLAIDHNVLRIWKVSRSQYLKDNFCYRLQKGGGLLVDYVFITITVSILYLLKSGNC